MRRQFWLGLLAVTLVGLTQADDAKAQYGVNYAQQSSSNLPRYSYYPYYYFPHSYWPQHTPQWPEPQGSPYVKPPAYMAYPPFREPGWRYWNWAPKKYYRGSHFWLDQF